MDLTVALRLQARTDGVSAVREMRKETSELAAAIKEVREAARSGGQVSGSTIKALGGFDEFHKAFAAAQRDIAAGAGGRPEAAPDAEKRFRSRLSVTNSMAKVRMRESQRVGAAELKAEMAERAEAQETLRFKLRMRAQERREAEDTAAAEVRAAEQAAREETRAAQEAARAQAQADRETERSAQEALRFRMRMTRQMFQEMGEQEAREGRQRREAMRGMGLGMFAGPGEEGEHGGGHHGRGLASEFKTAAGYTLVYGGINKLLEGVAAVANAPFALGRMTLGVANQSREISESAAALGVSTRAYQDLRLAFAGKGIGEERVQPMLNFMEKSAIAGIRGVKTQTVAFRALGISMKELRSDSRDPMKLLTAIAEGLDHIRNPSKKTAIADMIFGRDGSKYLALFENGYLRKSFAASEASGATMSDPDLAAGRKVSEQWKEMQMQMAGIRNEVAAAAFPIMSQLIGDASGWLQHNRAAISDIIHKDMDELKADLPAIEDGFTNVANSVLSIAKEFPPILHSMVEFSKSPFAKYMFSGQIIPGGLDLSSPKDAAKFRANMTEHSIDPGGLGRHVLDAATWAAHKGAEIAGRVEVTVRTAPGTSIASMHAEGNVTAVHRGQLSVAH